MADGQERGQGGGCSFPPKRLSVPWRMFIIMAAAARRDLARPRAGSAGTFGARKQLDISCVAFSIAFACLVMSSGSH